jgi:hypothetical protein
VPEPSPNLESIPLACNPAALDERTRAEHFRWIREELPRLVTSLKLVPGGAELEFRAADLVALARFVDRERRCCPFLRFELTLPAGEEILRLRLTLPGGVKQFLAGELHLHVGSSAGRHSEPRDQR